MPSTQNLSTEEGWYSRLARSRERIAALEQERDEALAERETARSAARVYRMALRGDTAAAVVAAFSMEQDPELEWLKE